MFAINHCTVTPVRQEPSEGSEQLTQLLFGEVCEVLDRLPRWTKIRSTLDGQEGWVDFKMLSPAYSLSPITDSLPTTVVSVPMAIATDMETGDELMLTLGTRLPNYAHGTFEVLGKQYLIDPNCVSGLEDALRATGRSQDELQDAPLALQARGEEICAIAQTLLNAPYLWGGKNAMGMDCSGFTQVVYATQGINLLRNAREQMTQGKLVPSLAEAQPGDLAFFDHADRDPKATNISHVGLLLDNKTIIHCSGCVHIDAIDEQGIHLHDGELTHHLVQIKRYL
ncbi:MAG: C40 family peptidase [Paludibacteraceae bacterium]|nr:C40 family peptidase [Paludibacteraceae bacterium]